MPTASSPTRERLLDEAMRLFGERGFGATSVAEIERAAGLTPGAGGLFHHFKSKEAVLRAGIDRHLERLEALRKIRGAVPPLGNLRAELTILAKYVFLELREERELLRVLLTEARQRPDLLGDAVERLIRGTFREFAEWLRHGTGGELPGDADAIAAVALGGLAYFCAAEALLDQPPVDTDDDLFITTWVDMVERFLTPRA